MRRYAALAPSSGTRIPEDLRREVIARDRAKVGGNGCVGRAVGMPVPCGGSIELDHVRASHAMGMKSPTTADNLATLCGAHHRFRTEHGSIWRPLLLVYLAEVSP